MISVLAVAQVQGQVLGSPFGPGDGFSPSNGLATSRVTSEQVHAKLSAIESASDLDETQRERAVQLYKQTLSELEENTSLSSKLSAVREGISAVPDQTNKTRREIKVIEEQSVKLDDGVADAIARLEGASAVEAPSEWLILATKTLELIESRRIEQQSLLNDARASLVSIQSEPKKQADRRLEVPTLIHALQERIEAIDAELNSNTRSDEIPRIIDANRQLLEVRKRNAFLEMEILKKELEFYDASSDLLPLRVDLTQRKVNQLEQSVALYSAAADRLRQRINLVQTRVVATEAKRYPSELNRLVEKNAELTARRQEVGASIQETREQLDASTKLTAQLRQQFDRLQTQLGPGTQVTEAIGQLLLKNRQDLPSARKLRDVSETRQAKLYDVRFELIDSEQQLWPLLDLEARIGSEIQALGKELPASRLGELEPDVRQLLQSQKSIREGLNAELETYYRDLAALNFHDEQLIAVTESYTEFIEERVLWIRSLPPLSLADIGDAETSLRWLFDHVSWSSLTRSAWASAIHSNPFLNALFVISLVGLLGTRSKCKRRIVELGESAESHLCRDIGVTLKALLYSFLCAALWPVVLAWISWNLFQVNDGGELVRPFANAFAFAAVVTFPLELWRCAASPKGLGEAHFHWPQRRSRLLRSNVCWFEPTWVLSIFLFHVFHATDNLIYQRSLARFCFLSASIFLSLFVHRVASPTAGLLWEYLVLNRDGWLNRLRWVWYPLLVGIPISFVLLSVLGYQYTASHLMQRFTYSALVLSVVYIGLATGLRWITLRRRAIYIQQLRKRKAESAETGKERVPTADSVGGVTLTEGVDLSTVKTQSIRIMHGLAFVATVVALYFIWAGTMPALARFEEVPLLPLAGDPMVGAATPRPPVDVPASLPQTPALVESIPDDFFAVSLGQLMAALAIMLVTFIAVQNIPGFMEIALLQRLPLDASLRFAVTTLTRYLLVTIGIVWVFGALGIGWGKVQWLVAALTVGLGFGLQEIFANFVSGLILLFERPLRVGDVVTVGDTSGTVVRINTRSTTIRDWDRKELIVPNKEFITGKLLNWTLDDTIHRMIVRVGIAYGSDVKQAQRLVLDIASRHPGVLDDPAPSVVFDAFGESTLNLTLRCFLPSLDGLFPVTHELHEAIHRELRDAGIEIALPQRDIHVRSIDAFRGATIESHDPTAVLSPIVAKDQ
jgi:potassium efflux system protein